MGGAKSQPVIAITDADLEANGGQYKLTGKYAVKVNGNDSLSVIGGVPSVVYPVSQAQIAIGEFELIQGHAIDVTQVTDRGQESSAWAMPVYHAGPGTWPPGGGVLPGSSLLDGLVAYWALEETGQTADREDALGNHDLTVTGSIANVAGIQGNGDEYGAGDWIGKASVADLSPGNANFTISFWHKVPGTANRNIINKWLGTGNQREYSIRIVAQQYTFWVSANGAGNPTDSVTAISGLSVGQWAMITVWHDATNNLIGIQIDQDTPVTKAYSDGVFQGTGMFQIAGFNDVSANLSDDDIDEVGFWSRVLTAAERTELYNGGSGNTYPFEVEAAGITVANIDEYQVFQRTGATADMLISGGYTGSPAAIEARFNGGSWATIDAAPAGGTYSGTLAGQAEGQGTLEVRYTNDTAILVSIENVGIGDVFLVAGQSNAEGRLTNPQVYSHATLKAAMFREDNLWAELSDPSDSDPAAGGSIWPLLATLLMASQGVPVAFITVADGSTGLVAPDANWTQGGANYNNAVNKISASNVNGILAVLFAQGERDVVNGISAADYQTALSQMLDDLQTDTGFAGMKMVSYLAPAQYSTEADADINAIRMAHVGRWANDADILPGPTGHDQSFADGLHWSTDAQGQRLAERWWRVLLAHFYSGVEAARGPQFSTAIRSGATVTVTFTGGEGSLQNQDDPTGFAFTDDGTSIGITVAVANGTDAVDLTLASVPVGVELLSFANGNDAAGAALSDSGTYPLPPEPFVDEAVS